MARDGEENAIAVDDFPGFAHEESTVRIAVEGDAKARSFGYHALLQSLEMKRTAAIVDVSAIGRNTHRNDISAERAEEFRAQLIGGAVGAIKNDAESGKARAGKDAAAEKIEIFGVERGIGRRERRIFRRRIRAMLEDVGFEVFFDGIWKFHAGVREKLHSIVLVWIV